MDITQTQPEIKKDGQMKQNNDTNSNNNTTTNNINSNTNSNNLQMSSSQASQTTPPQMDSSHRMVYLVFFIVLFFVIALIALVKFTPLGDTSGKAIDILNSKCVDTNGVVTFSDVKTSEAQEFKDSCAQNIAIDYACTSNTPAIPSKKVIQCNYGCDGVSCKKTAAAETCVPQQSYCAGNNNLNLITFSCVSGNQIKKVTQCLKGCNAQTLSCN